MEVAGLAASLRELPKSEARIIVYTTSDELACCASFLSGGTADDGAAPGENLDLWAQILTRIAGRKVEMIRVSARPKTPADFVAAWADLARDKAKATGPFIASIPKPNLAKVTGLGVM